MSDYQDFFVALAITSPAFVIVSGGIWIVAMCDLSRRTLLIIGIAFVLSFALSTAICRNPRVQDELWSDHSGYE